MLDINTPRGQRTRLQEIRAAEIFESHYRSTRYVDTDKNTWAKIDSVLVKDNTTVGVVLTSCREFTLDTLEREWDWEWLLTWRKVAQAASASRLLQTTLYGFLYLVPDDLLLVRRLFNSLEVPPERWRVDRRYRDDLVTKATVNGGSALRYNVMVKMDKARRLRHKK